MSPLTEGDLELDEHRLAAAKRASQNATSAWAADYWAVVHKHLEANIRARNLFDIVGGSERVSNVSVQPAWNH